DLFEPREDRRVLPEVAAELYDLDAAVARVELAQQARCGIGASVVDEDDLVDSPELFQDAREALVEDRQRTLFIEDGDQDRDLGIERFQRAHGRPHHTSRPSSRSKAWTAGDARPINAEAAEVPAREAALPKPSMVRMAGALPRGSPARGLRASCRSARRGARTRRRRRGRARRPRRRAHPERDSRTPPA